METLDVSDDYKDKKVHMFRKILRKPLSALGSHKVVKTVGRTVFSLKRKFEVLFECLSQGYK